LFGTEVIIKSKSVNVLIKYCKYNSEVNSEVDKKNEKKNKEKQSIINLLISKKVWTRSVRSIKSDRHSRF